MTIPLPYYIALRRWNAFLGLFAVGAFLVEHVVVNSFSASGPFVYNAVARSLAGIPNILLIEALCIWLPMALHVGGGLWLASHAPADAPVVDAPWPWQPAAQRASGIALAFFVPTHMAVTRLAPHAGRADTDYFTLMAHQLREPLWLAIYVAGMLAASFHAGNGLVVAARLWGWGGTRTPKALTASALLVFLAFSIAGVRALLGFRT